MKIWLLLFSCTLVTQVTKAQNVYADFTATLSDLRNTGQDSERDALWNALVSSKKIPLVAGDSVAFLFRGEARSVTWMGDFDGWGSSKSFKTKGSRIPGTDIWMLKTILPADARLDYKILIDDREVMLDPVNPFNQWSGVGGGSLNSEVRMPGWREDPLTITRIPEAPKGIIVSDILFSSRQLGYQVTYSVYTPPGYRPGHEYSIMYVTDGYEYMHERLGNMTTLLDNLIYLGKMEPVVAVFVDHRQPVNRSLNRRMQELSINDKYLKFMTNELVPAIEKNFSVTRNGDRRAIIGTSIGGLSAAWLSFSSPDVFGRAGIQSPAFWFKPEIYALCDKAEALPQKVFLSTGLIHDSEDATRKMRELLDKRNCPYQFKTVNQGHSWGNWRDLSDDMLVYLFPSVE